MITNLYISVRFPLCPITLSGLSSPLPFFLHLSLSLSKPFLPLLLTLFRFLVYTSFLLSLPSLFSFLTPSLFIPLLSFTFLSSLNLHHPSLLHPHLLFLFHQNIFPPLFCTLISSLFSFHLPAPSSNPTFSYVSSTPSLPPSPPHHAQERIGSAVKFPLEVTRAATGGVREG